MDDAVEVGVEQVAYFKSIRPHNKHMGRHLKEEARAWADELGEPLPDKPTEPDSLVYWFAQIWMHRIVEEMDDA